MPTESLRDSKCQLRTVTWPIHQWKCRRNHWGIQNSSSVRWRALFAVRGADRITDEIVHRWSRRQKLIYPLSLDPILPYFSFFFLISTLPNYKQPAPFTGGGIRCPCRKCQNKKYLHPDVVTMHFLHKGFMENYQCWYAHGEVFVSKKRMEERVVGSTSSASNVHEATNNNTNPYRNMVMDAMKMN